MRNFPSELGRPYVALAAVAAVAALTGIPLSAAAAPSHMGAVQAHRSGRMQFHA